MKGLGPRGERWRVPFCPDCGVAGKHLPTCTCFPGEPVVHGNFEWVVLERRVAATDSPQPAAARSDRSASAPTDVTD